MASKVYSVLEVSLQDDKDITIKPLPIARLRKFMEAWKKFSEAPKDADMEEYSLNVYINCSGIALEHEFADLFGGKEKLYASLEQKKKGHVLSPEYKDYLEEVLELDTIFRILDVAGGIKLDDPKLMEAAEALTSQAAGTN